ncbi:MULTISPECIES: hypothetical protein [unclassified Pseudomonas]|uniref:hypothetical protein n=1 Tax=unclassified Pseudomonas TaxID=196821 RepID=UPI00072FC144|nr:MULTISPECIES: hypothetical protein [unclassified Pseudomonas]KSW22629.1 hypothetical protein AOX63_04165 [Pseudomonas sp. ADP]OBP11397.1 hypothetical protein BAE52_09810 [Pseudomonas sp. EGD-AKN5]QOF85444.1 hypothetical protein IG194_01610 [Pseudomonas sp. ADPe]
MASTLLLDRSAWDLVLDGEGNVALATEPYAIAQDVASAVRTFLGECWYDTTQGLPYWQQILGKYPPVSLIKKKIEMAALTVPKVAEVKTIAVSFTERGLTGQIQIIDTDGQEAGVSF